MTEKPSGKHLNRSEWPQSEEISMWTDEPFDRNTCNAYVNEYVCIGFQHLGLK